MSTFSVENFFYGTPARNISVPSNCQRLHLYGNGITHDTMPVLPPSLQELHFCGNPLICSKTLSQKFNLLPQQLRNFIFCGNGIGFHDIQQLQFPKTLQRLYLYGNYISPHQLLQLQLHKQCPNLQDLRVLSMAYEANHPIERKILKLCRHERERFARLRTFAICAAHLSSSQAEDSSCSEIMTFLVSNIHLCSSVLGYMR